MCIRDSMNIDRRDPHAFNAHDMELAIAFANQAAVAIDNARLFARQQRHAEEMEQGVRERTRDLEVLYGVTATAVDNLDMVTFLQRAMGLTVGAFGCGAAATYLAESSVSGLHLAALLAGGGPSLLNQLPQPGEGEPLLWRQMAGGVSDRGGGGGAWGGGGWWIARTGGASGCWPALRCDAWFCVAVEAKRAHSVIRFADGDHQRPAGY